MSEITAKAQELAARDSIRGDAAVKVGETRSELHEAFWQFEKHPNTDHWNELEERMFAFQQWKQTHRQLDMWYRAYSNPDRDNVALAQYQEEYQRCEQLVNDRVAEAKRKLGIVE